MKDDLRRMALLLVVAAILFVGFAAYQSVQDTNEFNENQRREFIQDMRP